MRILIANRGEIARRIIRTAHRLGHETVAVFADPDRAAPFVGEADIAHRLGPAQLASSYLSIERLVAAVAATGADAVHPGYGFLAERADFARAVIDAGALWIGPHPGAIEAMGSKIEARRLAAAAGIPVIPGFDASQAPDELAAAADRIGYPVLIKASGGGGGKGIRVVRTLDAFAAALTAARDEAERTFADGTMIVERYVERPRHVEVQIVGDRHGTVVHLGTRECSVQRRYQKLLEEAPAPNLPADTRDGLHRCAVALAASLGYDSAGTVEFVVDDETGDYFFLEVNTRLQVEHPVTELVTGLDLVELMIGSATGHPLPFTQSDVRFDGHAFEARINAEDPSDGFAPQVGTIAHLVIPEGVRWDSAIELGDAITTHYDPMIAKLIVHGDHRDAARRRLGRALDRLVVGGVTTTAGLHRWLVDQPAVVAGRVTTRFLDETDLPAVGDPPFVEAARAWADARAQQRDRHCWHALAAFRVTPARPATVVALRDATGTVREVDLDGAVPAADVVTSDRPPVASSVDLAARSVAVTVAGLTHTFLVPSRTDRWAASAGDAHGVADALTAPFPGTVASVAVVPGRSVAAGDPLVVLEAMKMLHTLTATGAGVVADVRVAAGDHVDAHHVLVTFHPEVPDP